MDTPPPQAVVVPEDLFLDILSRLLVKGLMRLRCVAKSFNTIICDPSFLKFHLNISSQNPKLLLEWVHLFDNDSTIVPYPVRDIVENRLITIGDDSRIVVGNRFRIVGSYNGLICLSGYSLVGDLRESWIQFWNPTMKLMTDRSGILPIKTTHFKCFFGFDNSTDTYKVVMFDSDGEEENNEEEVAPKVRIFNSGNNIWRDIENFPTNFVEDAGFYLRGTLNWLDEFSIVSLDLGTETCTNLLLPPSFDEVSNVDPQIANLMDSLCFCHDSKGTHFVVWKMTEFGVIESWTQLLKVSYRDLHMNPIGDNFPIHLTPLCLYNGNTLIFETFDEDEGIIYNMRDNRVDRTRITNEEICWVFCLNYIESLVWPY